MKRHLHIILTIVIVALLGALIIQNHAPVRAQLLFVAVEMPLILLLALTSGLGFIPGLLAACTGTIKPKSRTSGRLPCGAAAHAPTTTTHNPRSTTHKSPMRTVFNGTSPANPPRL